MCIHKHYYNTTIIVRIHNFSMREIVVYTTCTQRCFCIDEKKSTQFSIFQALLFIWMQNLLYLVIVCFTTCKFMYHAGAIALKIKKELGFWNWELVLQKHKLFILNCVLLSTWKKTNLYALLVGNIIYLYCIS